MQKDFYINGRFFIEPAANMVTDLANGKRTRLESRIMQLLSILADKQGKPVTRQELVTLIWQDYGGGDEGLTQSISVLRKILQDTEKGLVQTIPKKGYILNAEISFGNDGNPATELKQAPKTHTSDKRKWVMVAALFAILFATYFAFFSKKQARKADPTPTNVPYPTDMAKEEQSEENEFNTIVTRGSDSTLYKLMMVGDRPAKFFINNSRLAEDQWEPYMSLINSLKKQLSEKQKAE